VGGLSNRRTELVCGRAKKYKAGDHLDRTMEKTESKNCNQPGVPHQRITANEPPRFINAVGEGVKWKRSPRALGPGVPSREIL